MLKWHKARIDITMDQGSQTHKHCGLQVSAEGLLYGFVKWKRDKKETFLTVHLPAWKNFGNHQHLLVKTCENRWFSNGLRFSIQHFDDFALRSATQCYSGNSHCRVWHRRVSPRWTHLSHLRCPTCPTAFVNWFCFKNIRTWSGSHSGVEMSRGLKVPL